MNDDVSKLKHMGKETVKKLRNLSDSAQQAGVVLPADLPVQRVTKGNVLSTDVFECAVLVYLGVLSWCIWVCCIWVFML